jgi:hypothetical protein
VGTKTLKWDWFERCCFTKQLSWNAHPDVHHSMAAEAERFSNQRTTRGEGGSKEPNALRVKSALKGKKPMDGTGMKQGRQMSGGAKPREREKR